MNCTKMRTLLSKHPKNRKNLRSVKEITTDLMIYFKEVKKEYWPEDFLKFLSAINKHSIDLDEQFCLLQSPNELLSELISTEIFTLAHSHKQHVFKYTCCGKKVHGVYCNDFWEEFLYILQEFILLSTQINLEYEEELILPE